MRGANWNERSVHYRGVQTLVFDQFCMLFDALFFHCAEGLVAFDDLDMDLCRFCASM